MEYIKGFAIIYFFIGNTPDILVLLYDYSGSPCCSKVKDQKMKLLTQIFVVYQGNCSHSSLGNAVASPVIMNRTG
jgi:hypothetical protein